MVATNAGQGMAILALLFVHTGSGSWIPYAVVFVTMSMAAFFAPAEAAIIPNLVEEEFLVSANGLNSLIDNTARLAGPPIGGILIAWLGIGSVAIADGVTFFAAALLITFVRSGSRPDMPGSTVAEAASSWVSAWREWRDGLALVVTNRAIGAVILVAVVTSFGGTMIDPMFAPWVRSVIHGNAAVLGSLSTAGALGGMLGGVLLGQFGRFFKPSQLFATGNIVTSALLAVMYSLAFLPAVVVLSFVKSVPLVGTGAGLQTLLQSRVPDNYRGRVYGALGTSNALVGLAGVWLAGTLAEVIGIVHVLYLSCAIMACAGALGLLVLSSGTGPSTRDEAAGLGETVA
jgi:predicted MFS family arabinose efflux permease